jgi:hypothetical protein
MHAELAVQSYQVCQVHIGVVFQLLTMETELQVQGPKEELYMSQKLFHKKL